MISRSCIGRGKFCVRYINYHLVWVRALLAMFEFCPSPPTCLSIANCTFRNVTRLYFLMRLQDTTYSEPHVISRTFKSEVGLPFYIGNRLSSCTIAAVPLTGKKHFDVYVHGNMGCLALFWPGLRRLMIKGAIKAKIVLKLADPLTMSELILCSTTLASKGSGI